MGFDYQRRRSIKSDSVRSKPYSTATRRTRLTPANIKFLQRIGLVVKRRRRNGRVLNVNDEVVFDDRITDYQWHNHMPINSSMNNSDEIIISIQQQDIFTVPSKSFLYIQGQVKKEADQDVKLVRNAFLFLFDEIKYQLNGVLIDHVRNPGITTTLKGYVSFTRDKVETLEIAGWKPPSIDVNLTDEEGNFDCCIPLDTVMGIFEDYNRIILQGRHELILHRSKSDNDNACRSCDYIG
ncbi:uncharacterized protein [Rhodnius prolixus]|uniref:uncharacterized protein n=1 Tax=Rhodnius prolixus TaxID=13249 RepID=UPI003D18CA15